MEHPSVGNANMSQDVKDHLAHVEHLLAKSDNLPLCNIPMSQELKDRFALEATEEYSTFNKEEYDVLCKEIEGLIGADCWAVVANNEVLFNSYNSQSVSIKNHIQNDIIRKELYTDIHGAVLMHFNRSDKVNTLDIYMWETDSWKVRVEYDPTSKKYTVSCFTSSDCVSLVASCKSLLSTT